MPSTFLSAALGRLNQGVSHALSVMFAMESRTMKSLILSTFALMLTVANAAAQNAPPPAEVAGEPVSYLMFFTLGAVLLIAIGAFVWFLRKRSNREAAERALDPNNPANR
jgi:heme/copper-type cytochrome/quinol oxidase subunit 2